MNNVTFYPDTTNELQCPDCAQPNLHQKAIEVFDRKEDATEGIHVRVEEQRLFSDPNLERNPSPRRQGLLIYFECEHCEGSKVLKIYQHKGTTYMEWCGI